ncbi:RNA polymerase sigma factor [Carboxydochorda subterranea]|uniref:RNA polymerase sigma factor n=1 Tax=Carboxydichorda subterranea TaxID=3109565 RepID=A0ABZ1BWU7_9FIRM|nr:RNA polymerase sigma factor [Limnochorda sp. L945t]WRP17153.1 RNA polymerase sigma factor [Limnochorda sp. L945t]
MARLAAGDVGALEELYDRHAATLYGVLARLVPNRLDREEILQETFLAVWRHARTYDGRRGSVSSWLYAIAHRKAIDLLRSRRMRRPELPSDGLLASRSGPDGPGGAEPVLDAIQASEQRDAVVQALGTLQPEQRDVVVLAYFYGYSSSEIAALRQIPVGTVKSRMQRALDRLRRLLGREGAPGR